MFFNRRQEPQEFRSEMPEYDEDQDEYYGEEDDGDAGDDYDDEDDEGDDEEGAKPAKKGGGNAVRVALMTLAGVGVISLGGYYAATLLAPEAVNEIVNSYFGGGDETATAPPADAAAPPPGEAAPPPAGDTKPVDQAAAPGDKPAGKPAPADKPTEGAPAEGQPEGAEAPKPVPSKFKVPTPDPAVLKPSQPGEGDWVQPEAVVAPKPPVKVAAKKPRPKVAAWKAPSKWAQRQSYLRKVRAQRLAAYRKRHGRGYYAQGHHAKPTRTWHARYSSASASSRGTGWISGQSTYIPWGGGHAGASHHRASGHRHAAPRGRYGVQVGSFANPTNAQSLVSQLRSQGIPAYVGHGVGMTRVYVGAYKNRYAAGAAMRSLQTQGIPAAVTAH